jgi:hypothetical protein
MCVSVCVCVTDKVKLVCVCVCVRVVCIESLNACPVASSCSNWEEEEHGAWEQGVGMSRFEGGGGQGKGGAGGGGGCSGHGRCVRGACVCVGVSLRVRFCVRACVRASPNVFFLSQHTHVRPHETIMQMRHDSLVLNFFFETNDMYISLQEGGVGRRASTRFSKTTHIYRKLTPQCRLVPVSRLSSGRKPQLLFSLSLSLSVSLSLSLYLSLSLSPSLSLTWL